MTKESTLRRRNLGDEDGDTRVSAKRVEGKKTILRKTFLGSSSFRIESSYNSKVDSCVFFPKIPRSWMPDGLIIIPSLSEKGTRGTFDLEVFSSEPVFLTALPDSYSRSISGSWVEGAAGGSHLVPATWKKNPKYSFTIKNSAHSREVGVGANTCLVRLTLSRSGSTWKSLCRKNTLSSMIGFYIFVSRNGELTQVFESTFVTSDEVSTDPSFALAPLFGEDEYVIMPTTYSENIMGAFVLSVISEHEFSIRKEK